MRIRLEHDVNRDAPLLIVVNGRPGTGKSYLAEMLSTALRIPLFAKDALKETLGAILGAEDRSASQRLGTAAIALMYEGAATVLRAGFPAILESPLVPQLAARDIEAVQARTECRVVQLFLRAEPAIMLERFRVRTRDGVHFHAESLVELEAAAGEELEPVPIRGETLMIDTTNFETVDYGAIADYVRARL
jgi:predicted kinase